LTPPRDSNTHSLPHNPSMSPTIRSSIPRAPHTPPALLLQVPPPLANVNHLSILNTKFEKSQSPQVWTRGLISSCDFPIPWRGSAFSGRPTRPSSDELAPTMRSRSNKKYPRPRQDTRCERYADSFGSRHTPFISSTLRVVEFPSFGPSYADVTPLLHNPNMPGLHPHLITPPPTSQVDTWTLAHLRCFQWLVVFLRCTMYHMPRSPPPPMYFRPRFCLLLCAQPFRDPRP